MENNSNDYTNGERNSENLLHSKLHLESYASSCIAPSLYTRLKTNFPAVDRISSIPIESRPSSTSIVAQIFAIVAPLDNRIQINCTNSSLSTISASCMLNRDPIKALKFDFDHSQAGFSHSLPYVSNSVSGEFDIQNSAWPSWADLPLSNLLHLRTMMYIGENYSINERLIGHPSDASFLSILRLLIICGVTIIPNNCPTSLFHSNISNDTSSFIEEMENLRILYRKIQAFLQEELTAYMVHVSDVPIELLRIVASYIHE